MLDQVGQARTKPGPVGASRGKLRSTGTNREWPDTMLGAKPEPDRNPTGSDRSKIGDSPEPGRSQTGVRPGPVRHCPDPAADRDGTGNPRLPPASGFQIRRLNRAIGPKSLIGHVPGRAPDSYGPGRRDKPALTYGCFGPPNGLIGPFATGVWVVWRGTMAAKFDCSVRSGSQTGQPDREAGLENGPEKRAGETGRRTGRKADRGVCCKARQRAGATLDGATCR